MLTVRGDVHRGVHCRRERRRALLLRCSILWQGLIPCCLMVRRPWHVAEGGRVQPQPAPGRVWLSASPAQRLPAAGGCQGGRALAPLGCSPRGRVDCWQPRWNQGAGAEAINAEAHWGREDPVSRRGAKAPPSGPHRPLSQRRLNSGTMAEVCSAAAAEWPCMPPAAISGCCCCCLPRCCAYCTQKAMHCAFQLPPAPDVAAHLLLRRATPWRAAAAAAARNIAAPPVTLAGEQHFKVLGGRTAPTHPSAAPTAC